ncbi:MAG: putative alpha/beta-fold hydrolase [Patiriisocius sp.]|jgi:predicted alpha/beta-fold hydrolase
MPIIPSAFQAKGLFKSGHFSTIYSAKLRPIPTLVQHRKRLELTDGDFVDVDWSYHISEANKAPKVAILLHGLEGDAQRVYMKGHGKQLVEHGWDVAAMNHRGCSGEENRLYLSYNSGRTEDLSELIDQIVAQDYYHQIALVGFSLGGNLLLKYLGEGREVSNKIVAGVAVSAPVHLQSSLDCLMRKENLPYTLTFLHDLRSKYKRKMTLFPEVMTQEKLNQIRTLLDFDNIYTAPAHGFKDAADYYEKSSALQFLPNVKTPVLLLNAANDTFLAAPCYPFDLAKNHKNIYLEVPKTGGHVGFHTTNTNYYSERRVLDFLNTIA